MSREQSPQPEEMEDQTVAVFLGNLWEKLAPDYPVTHPDFWMKVMELVKECLVDQNSTHLSDFEKLEEIVSKISKLWKKNFSRWSAATFGELYAKTSRLLAATYQTLFSSTLLKNVEDCVDGCLAADPLTLEDFSSGLMKETISTSSTTARGAMDHVDASGTKKR